MAKKKSKSLGKGVIKPTVETTESIAARIQKLAHELAPSARGVKSPAEKEIGELVWMLKSMADAHLGHVCPAPPPPVDYHETYADRALKTEYTRPFLSGLNGVPDQQLSRIFHAALGMSGEIGEIIDSLKKTLVYDRPLDRVNLLEEAGDLKWYYALYLRALEATDRVVGEANIAKLGFRYGGSVFSSAKAINRDPKAEKEILAKMLAPPKHEFGHVFTYGNSLLAKCAYCRRLRNELNDEAGACPVRLGDVETK